MSMRAVESSLESAMGALPITEAQLAELEELCRRFGVRRLALFGSAVRQQAKPGSGADAFDPARSDFDFTVEFDYSGPLRPSDQYFGLKEELESVLRRPVDLVCYTAIRNPYFRQEVDETQVELYAA